MTCLLIAILLTAEPSGVLLAEYPDMQSCEAAKQRAALIGKARASKTVYVCVPK